MCFRFPHSKHRSANPSAVFSWVALCLSNPLTAGMSSKPIVDPFSHPLYLQFIETRPLLLTVYWNYCDGNHKDTHSNNCIWCTLLFYFPLQQGPASVMFPFIRILQPWPSWQLYLIYFRNEFFISLFLLSVVPQYVSCNLVPRHSA